VLGSWGLRFGFDRREFLAEWKFPLLCRVVKIEFFWGVISSWLDNSRLRTINKSYRQTELVYYD